MCSIKNITDLVCEISFRLNRKFNKKRLFARKYKFTNHSTSAQNLLIVLAGFQEYYWQGLSNRIKKAQEQFDEEIDICVCVPRGVGDISLLESICDENHWSFLYMTTDRLGMAQNTAIQLFPKAKWIFKIDEDIVLCDNYFSLLKNGYKKAEKEINRKIGFAGPLINLNACCTEFFIETINKSKEFADIFGPLRIGLEEKIHTDVDMAEWIWENTLPFDEVSKIIEERNKNQYAIACYRYSIGAILFKREWWEEIGYFSTGADGVTGLEEVQVCAHCMNNMEAIVIIKDCLAGHLGFYRQKNKIREFYNDNFNSIVN